MPDFRDFKSLEKYLQRELQNNLNEIIKEIKEDVKEYIMENLYNAYDPNQYERSFEFLESVSVYKARQTESGISAIVYFDTDKINAVGMSGRFNQHMSVDGKDVSDYIPQWLEEGTQARRNNIFPRDGIYSMENVKKDWELNGKHVKKLQQLFRNKGIHLEFTR